jgi:hypothetical protein
MGTRRQGSGLIDPVNQVYSGMQGAPVGIV